jgi:hypothetical protein
MLRALRIFALSGSLAVVAAAAAHATYVPAGTLAINGAFTPTVNLSGGTVGLYQTPQGYHKFTFQSGTGQFVTADSSINGSDSPGVTSEATLNFSTTVGGVISYTASPLADILTFTDSTLGETYSFDLDQSITTLSDQTNALGTTIGLYILGDLTATGSTTYSSLTPTALTLSLTETGGSNWSISGTLANPPPGINVPEPASIALLGAGLIALRMVRRRKTV